MTYLTHFRVFLLPLRLRSGFEQIITSNLRSEVKSNLSGKTVFSSSLLDAVQAEPKNDVSGARVWRGFPLGWHHWCHWGGQGSFWHAALTAAWQNTGLNYRGTLEFSIRIELRSLRRQNGSIKHHNHAKRAIDRLKTNFAGLCSGAKTDIQEEERRNGG